MVHPNWSGVRVKPLVLFGSLPSVKNVLVAVDEKSIGLQSKVLMESTWDIRSYYQSQATGTPLPYIAVGCLGWVGDERWRLQRGERDTRELIRVLEGYAMMHNHKKELESERRRFMEQRGWDDRLIRNLRPPVIPGPSKVTDSSSGPAPRPAQDSPSGPAPPAAQDEPSGPAVPPAYWEVMENEKHGDGNENHMEENENHVEENENHVEGNETNQTPSERPVGVQKQGRGLSWKEFVAWCRENEEKGQTSRNA
jgi:hypothetical protein